MLYELKNVVKGILEDYPEARNSDEYLYLKVLEYLGFDPHTVTVADFYKYGTIKWQLPSIETVSRCRRKAQEDDATLKAVIPVRVIREEQRQRILKLVKGDKKYGRRKVD